MAGGPRPWAAAVFVVFAVASIEAVLEWPRAYVKLDEVRHMEGSQVPASRVPM